MVAAFAMAMVGQTFAFEGGEYYYTPTQRVKIASGENLVTNGDFKQGLENWKGTDGEAPNADVWSMEEASGPNGENAIKSVNGSTADAALCRAFEIPTSGTYMVTYDIKGETTNATGIVTGAANCIDIFLNSDGALTKVASTDDAPVVNVSGVDGYKDIWKTVAYVFDAEGGQKLVMHIEKLTTNTMITNVQIVAVTRVYDDRILKNKLAYVDRLIATEKFTKDTENQFIDNVVATMRNMLVEEGALDDPTGAQDMITAYEEELGKWLDLNAANLLKDEKKWSAYGDTRKQNAFGNWKGGYRGRWFHKNNGGSNEITNDGDEIGYRFQGGNALQSERIAYSMKPSQAGTYMFSIDVVGHYMAGTNSKQNLLPGTGDNYMTDWNRDFKGVTVYAGKDQLAADDTDAGLNTEQEGQKVDCGIISNPNAKVNPQKFVVFYDVTQEMVDAGENVWFGIAYIPDAEVTAKLGCNVNIANPQIRLIGVTQDAIDFQNEVAKIIVQQNAIKERYDLIATDLAKTAQDGYPWGHTRLDSVANAHKAGYEASLNVIDAEGNVKDEAKIKEFLDQVKLGTGVAYSDSLLNIVNTLNSARSTYNNTNNPIANYRQKVADAEAVYADEFYAVIGDRTTFRAAIDAAIAKLDEILPVTTDETRDADIETMNAQLAALAEAIEAYKKSGEMTPIIDIDFSNNFEATDEGHKIVGAKGEMNFTNANPENNNVDKEMSYAKGCGEEYLDVLRIGSAEAWVNIAEADQPGAEDVLRINFDMWSNRLSGKSIIVELRNAANQRVAGFKYDPYDNSTGYNDFDNEAGEGMKLNLNTSFMAGTAGDVATLVDAYKTSFTLIVDYKAKAVQGITVTTKGTLTGSLIPMRTDLGDGTETTEATPLEDTKIVKFVLSSDYATYQGRRCWFDNLKAYKYASFADGPIDTAIESVKTVATDGAIYNLQGQKVMNPAKGLYIINGKKFVIK